MPPMTQSKLDIQRRYRAKNREKIEAKRKLERLRNANKHRAKWLLFSYKMTVEDFDRRLEDQDGVCAICKRTCTKWPNLSVDHDHRCCPGPKSCGQCIRGLICDACNNGLGRFKENIEVLDGAIKYLKAWNSVSGLG